MSENKKPDTLSHKDLLYSEILNTSVTSHVRDLFVKKEKNISTYPIQRSSVLDRVSKFLKSADKADENVQNIEDIEEGLPVIDMNVTLIKEEDGSEYDEDSDDETEDNESLTSSDSDKEVSEYKSVDYNLHDTSVYKMLVSNNELSQNGNKDSLLKNNCILKKSAHKALESNGLEVIPLNQQPILSSDSDCEQLDSDINDESSFISSDSTDEQFKTENKEAVKAGKLATSLVNSNRLSSLESEMQNRNSLEISKPDFRLLIDNMSDSSCNHENSKQSLEDLRFKKRKLIAVIDDDDDSPNLCQRKTQKIV